MADKEPAKAAAPAKAEARVHLRTVGPKDRFDLSGLNLGVVDFVGKDFSASDADEVLIQALKYGVKLVAVKKED